MRIAIIGGGAAGFFAAIHVKKWLPTAEVIILEKSSKVLSKVKISGGGRCNVTNSFAGVSDLAKVYPRGHRLIKRLFKTFGPRDTFSWFENHGVSLVVQEDECVFPQAQDSEAIILCLKRQAQERGVQVKCNRAVHDVVRVSEGLRLSFTEGEAEVYDCALLSVGGTPHAEGHDWLSALGHQLETPCPSLFTFKIDDKSLTALMGIVVEDVQTAFVGTKMRAEGPLLITHWGVSGPAVLKLSSLGARYLSENNYKARMMVSWVGNENCERVMDNLMAIAGASPRKQLSSIRPYGMQQRLWSYLLLRCQLSETKLWGELGKKGLNKIVNVLTSDIYEIAGRGTYKDEFVTCGGVSLESVSSKTLESKVCPGLFFAGEVLDVDAVTGGFNLQAAWTTGYVAARSIAESRGGFVD